MQNRWTHENPFQSSQAVLVSEDGVLFFNTNASISTWETKLTFFWWKIEETETPIEALLRELSEKNEAAIDFSSEQIVEVCKDGPIKFDKWYFLAHIFKILAWNDVSTQIRNAERFESYDDFLLRWNSYVWGTSFGHVKSLVNKALAIWNSQN